MQVLVPRVQHVSIRTHARAQACAAEQGCDTPLPRRTRAAKDASPGAAGVWRIVRICRRALSWVANRVCTRPVAVVPAGMLGLAYRHGNARVRARDTDPHRADQRHVLHDGHPRQRWQCAHGRLPSGQRGALRFQSPTPLGDGLERDAQDRSDDARSTFVAG